jgi:hypothetical protein
MVYDSFTSIAMVFNSFSHKIIIGDKYQSRIGAVFGSARQEQTLSIYLIFEFWLPGCVLNLLVVVILSIKGAGKRAASTDVKEVVRNQAGLVINLHISPISFPLCPCFKQKLAEICMMSDGGVLLRVRISKYEAKFTDRKIWERK